MSERQASPYGTIARKWLALVERRQEHVIELCNSGRWRHYYTKTDFLAEMRRVLQIRDQWATIAGLPVSADVAADKTAAEPSSARPAPLERIPGEADRDSVAANGPTARAGVSENAAAALDGEVLVWARRMQTRRMSGTRFSLPTASWPE